MIRGTTPTHVFNLPFEASMLSSARAIYVQRSEEILRKETESFVMEGNTLRVTLTQEETFLFDCKYSVKIQLRVLTKAGKAMSTHPIIVSVDECLDGEVLA